jgi:hypothetical protein
MSHFHPDFTHFQGASGYRNRTTDHESKFQAFKQFVFSGSKASSFSDSFVIQFVCHPNFEAHRKTVTYFTLNTSTGEFDQSDSLPEGFQRANSFKNFKASGGHPKGLFYELNLYTRDGRSRHHTSRVTGSAFHRDDTHNQKHGATKGRHWLE